MKSKLLSFCIGMLFVPSLTSAQTFSSSIKQSSETFITAEPTSSGISLPAKVPHRVSAMPLSRIAFGVSVSPLGFGFQTATNLNSHLNVRGTGNFLNYNISNINTNGFTVSPKVNFASAGASLDIYPFHSGFRLSPGVLFYNQNQATAHFVAAAGTSFTLDKHTYYSAAGTNAVQGNGTFGLGNGSSAFTMTTGWGNMMPDRGGHWSFPFELGVAFIKDPTVALTLKGEVCDGNGKNCQNVATNAQAQADLATQVRSYAKDIQPLKTFPIVSFGVAYSFRFRQPSVR